MTDRPTLPTPNIYAGVPLDRAAHLRKAPSWLADALASPTARVVPVWRTRSLVAGPVEEPRAVLRPGPNAWTDPIFLGLMDDTPVFAADVGDLEQPDEHPELAGLGRFEDLRAVGPLMDRGEAALLAYARGIVWWNARHRHCGVCGSPAASVQAGHSRRCTNPACETQHFPRTDPAVIMLVHDGAGNVLLGRQKVWMPGMHSVLAGFVEPGESLEEAVAREVFEETGVRVDDVRYRSSQPWPFPASIMLGFTARALNTGLTIDPDELETALWVASDRLRTLSPDDPLRLPRKDSIARRLIEEWLAEG